MPRQRAVDVFNAVGSYVVGVAILESARARRAQELVAHIRSLPKKDFPVLRQSPSTWATPIPMQTIEEGLWHLINGLCSDLAD
jgi:hypothetical protein